ncbi:MAG: endonuclease III [Anaerolineae bacterium]
MNEEQHEFAPTEARVREIYRRLSIAAEHWDKTSLSYFEGQPFKALIAAMLSAQTREEHTLAAANALFALAETPEAMAQLSPEAITKAIRRVMYWERKVLYVQDIARQVTANGGVVPRTVDELIVYKGVGWKVAVLTLAVGYGIYDDITVDVHVARIGVRLGLVDPGIKQPPKVNDALKQVIPREYWPYWNGLMVQFGREVCLPTYPRCPTCPLRDLCPRIGVKDRS